MKTVAAAIFIAVLIASVLVTEPAVAASYTTRTTLLRNREFSEALTEGIRSAKKSVYLSFFLFKTTSARNNIPRRIAEELIQAKKRGLDVNVLLERPSRDRPQSGGDSLYADNRQTADLLARGGIKVYFDSPGVTTHTKVAVIDGRLVFIGSHNLSQSALQHNNELSVMLDSPELAAEVKAYLDRL
ncbi:cardiolipin synthase [Geobacter sp. OR-1]|uniref:phospholipase D-like domain-containing protein n=1 Tax=Geobacter sp. OR-1 TaxID=1266765 RepID=UPI000544566B|nr:phospholipase D-like domain-containing protein [Geobacter sp. OR-1]GAM08533.1 cardiolipin synthase [Geobacter sp. OR-1]